MAKTFISYARKDGDFVLKLAQDLRAAGADIWLDQLDIPTGKDWDDAVEDALEACGSFLVVLTPAARASRNVKNEIAFAIEEGKEIIPILHQPCKIPLNLIRKNWIDFAANSQTGMAKLLAVLNISLPKTPPPAPKPEQQSAQQPKPKAVPASSSKAQARLSLRATPNENLSGDDIKSMLKKHGFYASDWNKTGKGIEHAYEKQANGKIVYDDATGLYWQQSGSSDAIKFKDAQTYINKLNSDNFAGFSDWRLPTLEEAMSLMEPEKKHGKLYIDPVFDAKQQWIWTADRTPAGHVWSVDFINGFCHNDDVNDLNDVRAVRS